MDSQKLQAIVEPCLEEEKPLCIAACPFNLDVKGFIKKLKKKDFNGAYSIYRNQVLFPEIVSRICHKPCEGACIRKEIDDPVLFHYLEQSCIKYASNKDPVKFNLPPKDKKVVIIGAGLAGLSCALRMADRKYDVTLYEKTDKAGGRLIGLMEEAVYKEEIERRFQSVAYRLHLNTNVADLDELDFDAAFIATGAGGETFGLGAAFNVSSLTTEREGVFIGGNVIGTLPAESIVHGIRAADAMEKYLKTGSMEGYPEKCFEKESRLKMSTKGLEMLHCIEPSKEGGYTQDEASEEAGRCVECQCNACKTSCDLLKYFNKYPKKVASDVIGTIYPVIGVTNRTAIRLLSLCNMCGSCEEACPLNILVESILMAGRRMLHENSALPPAFHDFWIRDMFHSNGEKSYLAKNAPDHRESTYLFFPGCQLGASEPAYVEKTYEYLIDKLPDTGLMLGCCGAPAEWAGDEKLHRQAIEDIKSKWTDLGKPKAILACPTCKKMFAKYIPEMESISLYNVILENGIPKEHAVREKKQSIFDPCSSRYDPSMQGSVRALVKSMGLETEELNHSKTEAQCCGFGGHIYAANSNYTLNLTKNRTEQSSNPYITYCTNCRDSFSDVGKASWHILDIIFNIHDESRRRPSLTQRRRNRELLKENLLTHIWKESHLENTDESKAVISKSLNDSNSEDFMEIKIEISDELTEKMNRLLILEEDVKDTILHCENTGECLLDVKTGARTGHLKIGVITYWVTYKAEEEGYTLFNVYSHRIVLE